MTPATPRQRLVMRWARLAGPGGVRAVVAESVLVKQQLISCRDSSTAVDVTVSAVDSRSPLFLRGTLLVRYTDRHAFIPTTLAMVDVPAGGVTIHDVFLSHDSSDNVWVRSLCDALRISGLTVFLDEAQLRAPANFVSALTDGLRASRFLVLVATPRAALSKWVEQEWTAFLAEHGPRQRIIVVMLESVEVPSLLKTVQQIDATTRNVTQVAEQIVGIVGRADHVSEEDSRALTIGQDLVFVLARTAEGHLDLTDPIGTTRRLTPPWLSGSDYLIGTLGFREFTNHPIMTEAQSAELHRHARTLGELLFAVLFGVDSCRALLDKAYLAGRPRPLVTLYSDDDVLLSLPWELLHDGRSFLVRDTRIDLARSTLGPVGAGALLHEPSDFFTLVVNVSAPAGGGLHYEAESYRLTRVLSEHCQMMPTELGTVDDLVKTVARLRPDGIHFSGHGAPGTLQFEDNEGEATNIGIEELLSTFHAKVPDGRLPKFFYLASCHGNEPATPDQNRPGSESAAAAVHRAGIPQVVGYYGPISDELSTRAEEALYAAIAAGHSTRYAVRQGRVALAESTTPERQTLRRGDALPDAGRMTRHADAQTTGAGLTYPFAWAQLVYYHRGPDYPLGRPIPDSARSRIEAELQRTFQGVGDRKKLATGFIGRRTELHRVRKRLRRGDRVFVFQGLGGLGKTALAFETLALIAEENNICTLWCREAEARANTAEVLVAQLLTYCHGRFEAGWDAVVQQADRLAGGEAAQRFGFLLSAVLERVERLVVYLDNLESLLVAPRQDQPRAASGEPRVDADSFAGWRNQASRDIWRLLVVSAQNSNKLFVVASCRYRNDDFAVSTIPVSPLPDDALYRLMGWFPALRRLTAKTREALVRRLDRHPRAVEFANDLIADLLAQHEQHEGEWRLPRIPQPADVEREWRTLIEPALPRVRDRLRDDLLLAEIWDRVLDDRARRMLYRMTLLRQPWEWGLMAVLGEAHESTDTALATAERLLRTSLLEQLEVLRVVGAERERRWAKEYTLPLCDQSVYRGPSWRRPATAFGHPPRGWRVARKNSRSIA